MKAAETNIFALIQAFPHLTEDILRIIKARAAASRQDAKDWWSMGMTPALYSKYPGGAHELVAERTVVYRLADADYSQPRTDQEGVVSELLYELDLD